MGLGATDGGESPHAGSSAAVAAVSNPALLSEKNERSGDAIEVRVVMLLDVAAELTPMVTIEIPPVFAAFACATAAADPPLTSCTPALMSTMLCE